MAATRKNSKAPLHEQIYQQLSQSLMSGDLAPGEHLTIRAMAEELGTSMMPVREAVRRLSALKALEILPKRHVRVTPLSVGAFVEVAEMRKLLEARATRIACEQMTKAELRNIKAINRKLLSTTTRSKPGVKMKLNHEFHLAIYRCCHSELLLETIQHLWLRIGPYLNYILSKDLSSKRFAAQAFEHHAEIIEALESGDADRAVSAVHADIDSGTHRLLQAVKIEYSAQLNQLKLAE